MFEFLRYEGRKRLRGSVYLTLGMSTLAVFAIWAYQSFGEVDNIDELLDAYPEPMVKAFDIRTLATIEGFLSVELYVFGWVILLGLYLAYSAAGVVADDVDRGRMDTILAMPISRQRIVGEKFAAFAVPILMVNAVTPIVVLVSTAAIGESIAVADVLVLHLFAIPYLFDCAGIGLVASVLFDRASIAQRVALGVTFGLYLVESLVPETPLEPVGSLAPMRFFDPSAILLDGSYDVVGAGILVGMALLFLVASQAWFGRVDLA